jgi:hypothetical protein
MVATVGHKRPAKRKRRTGDNFDLDKQNLWQVVSFDARHSGVPAAK